MNAAFWAWEGSIHAADALDAWRNDSYRRHRQFARDDSLQIQVQAQRAEAVLRIVENYPFD